MASSGAGMTARIEEVDVAAFTVPTDFPEADGTIAWDRTTIVVAQATAAGVTGIGYTYATPAAAQLIRGVLAEVVRGRDAMAVSGSWRAMIAAVRNLGRPGVASYAIAALDNALWDLKARLLGVSVLTLLGPAREAIAAYGSGGFTTYSIERLQKQLSDWVSGGIRMVKMKVGTDPRHDVERVRAARKAIGENAALFVDANGAYSRKQALAFAEAFVREGVSWFEEPVSSDDLEGLRLLRDRAPPGMQIAAGEYGMDPVYFRRMLEAGAVDVLQVDATRCAGTSGFLKAAALCESWMIPLSAHTSPTLHAHLCCAVAPAIHVEYFHDHSRIERLLFEGAIEPVAGFLRPDPGRPGFGITLRRKEAERYAA